MKAPGIGERVKRAWTELTRAGESPGHRPQGRAFFRGAETSRLFYDWIASCLAPDEEIRSDLRATRARARDLSRNNAFVRRYLNLLSVNVIGPNGFGHQALVRDANGNLIDAVNEAIEEAWLEWSTGPVSADGKLNLVQIEQLLLETVATDGEAFVRFVMGERQRHGLALQGIDADIVDETLNMFPGTGTPEIRMGVEIDPFGKPTGYWIRDRFYLPGGYQRPPFRIDAAEMLHLGRTRRPNQTRYISWLAPAMLPLKMLSGYTESELVAARIGAAKMGFFEWSDPSLASPPGEDHKPLTIEANPGTAEELPPGLKFNQWSTDHPSTAYADFVKSIVREIAAALGVSYNDLANDLEGVSYSSLRGGAVNDRDAYRAQQTWWKFAFRQAVYERWLASAMLARRLRLPTGDWRLYTAARWTPKGWMWVDPDNDASAGQKAIQSGLSSRTKLLAEQGQDFEDVIEDLAREQKLAQQLGVRIDVSPAPAASSGSGGVGDGAGGAATDSNAPEGDAAASDEA